MSTKISKNQRAHLMKIMTPLGRLIHGRFSTILAEWHTVTIGGLRLPPLEEILRNKTGRASDHRKSTRGVYEADFEFHVDLPSGWLR